MARVELRLVGREQLSLDLSLDNDGNIVDSRLTGIGDLPFLNKLEEFRGTLKGPLKGLGLPAGHTSADLLMSEAILKLRGEWAPVYTEEELCHCRAVPFAIVDKAVVCGAHTPEKVSAWTSASTACGTCRPDVEAHLRFRLRSVK